MPHPLHEKIEHALQQRGLLKRDLARGLSVSPQTATDICKGRSAVTLPHLRNLVAMFALRADYWLDDSRLVARADDELAPARDTKVRALLEHDVLRADDPAAFLDQLLGFARERRDEFARRFPQLGDDLRAVLGFPARTAGRIGHVPTTSAAANGAADDLETTA